MSRPGDQNRMGLTPTALVAGLLLAGCAAPGGRELEYRLAKAEKSEVSLRQALDTEQAKVVALRREQAERERDLRVVETERNLLRERLQGADQRIDELTAMLHRQATAPLAEPDASGAALPAELDRALAGLARKYEGKLAYDPARGAVLLVSDRLFESGGDAIRPEMHEAIGALAAAASQSLPADWEMVVVGHTDDAPIVGEAVLARHPSNWHLSVHRAIAVRDLLIAAGLPQKRTAVMGYGPNRPIGSDRARNRRVEVYFVRAGDVRPLSGARPG